MIYLKRSSSGACLHSIHLIMHRDCINSWAYYSIDTYCVCQEVKHLSPVNMSNKDVPLFIFFIYPIKLGSKCYWLTRKKLVPNMLYLQKCDVGPKNYAICHFYPKKISQVLEKSIGFCIWSHTYIPYFKKIPNNRQRNA